MLSRDLIIEMKNSPMHTHHYQGGIVWTTFRPVPLNCIHHFHNFSVCLQTSPNNSKTNWPVQYASCLSRPPWSILGLLQPAKANHDVITNVTYKTTTGATKHSSWKMETFRLPIIWKTVSLTWTKPIRKLPFQARTLVDKQTTKSPTPPPPDSMLFSWSRTVSWQASLPTSTLHKGDGGREK